MKYPYKVPHLLYSYLATEMLGPFFASFLIMNCVFFLAKLIPFLNFVLELNIGFTDFLRLFSYLFPNIFLYSIPMAAMLGVTIGFARLSSDSEILALKANGISTYQIIPPVILVATLIALLTSFVSIKLIPLSATSMRQLSYQLLKEKISKGIKEHEFTEALGDVVVYVETIDKTSGQWTNVWVSDMRQVDNPIVTMASSGKMNSSMEEMMVSIELKNGSLHKPGIDNAQIVQFDQYRINIPLTLPETSATRQGKSTLNMRELLREAQLPESDIVNKRRLLIEYHKRLVLPVGCLMISLLGLPLGLQARPGKKAIGIQAGLAIFILYYILFTFGKAWAESGLFPVWFAMWAPNFLFFGLAVFWIIRVSNEQPLIPDVLSLLFKKAVATILFPLKTLFRPLLNKLQIVYKKTTRNETNKGSSSTTPVIRGNAESKEFHISRCEKYFSKNCTIKFKDINIAREAGFKPCDNCKKLIDEQSSTCKLPDDQLTRD